MRQRGTLDLRPLFILTLHSYTILGRGRDAQSLNPQRERLASARVKQLRCVDHGTYDSSRIRGIWMNRWERSTTINAPADKVFAYVSEFTRHGEWGGHGLAVTRDGDGPIAVGSTFSTTAKAFGTQREQS